MDNANSKLLTSILAKLTGLVKVALVSVIAWQLSQLVWQLSAPDQTIILSNQKMEQWMLAGAEPASLDKRFISSNLFTKNPVSQPKPKPVVAPKTALNMVLKAVFVSTDQRPSGAIIAVQGKATEYFAVGAELKPGIFLAEVQDDYVVLERGRGGERESLFFPKQDTIVRSVAKQESRSESPVTQQKPRKALQSRTSTNKALKSLPETDLGRDIQRLNPKAFMTKYQALLEENPQEVLGQAGISVAPSGVGYRIGQSQYTALLTSAGLKVGDVVLSVNGQVLGNATQDAQLVGSLANQKEVEVEIQRGSRQFMVSLPLGRR